MIREDVSRMRLADRGTLGDPSSIPFQLVVRDLGLHRGASSVGW